MTNKKITNKKTASQAPLAWTDPAWDDYLYWQATDTTKLERINDLIKDIRRDPFKGLGKPEPLVGPFSGFWSRRIDLEHRLVYAYEGGALTIMQARYHYEK